MNKWQGLGPNALGRGAPLAPAFEPLPVRPCPEGHGKPTLEVSMKPMEYVVVITDIAMSAEGVAVMDVTEAMGQVVACEQRQAQQSVGTAASVFEV